MIESDPFREALTLNGQDVAALYGKVLDQMGDGSYMRYRTVPVFPQVGDKINRAIEAIATNQMSSAAALKQAEQQAIEDIRKAGFTVNL